MDFPSDFSRHGNLLDRHVWYTDTHTCNFKRIVYLTNLGQLASAMEQSLHNIERALLLCIPVSRRNTSFILVLYWFHSAIGFIRLSHIIRITLAWLLRIAPVVDHLLRRWCVLRIATARNDSRPLATVTVGCGFIPGRRKRQRQNLFNINGFTWSRGVVLAGREKKREWEGRGCG